MKKYSLLMGLMCAALSITSCSKDNTETFDKPKGYEFELYAAPQTRTEVDGLDMKWSANDAMNVFHAPTGTTNYSDNDQFTVSDIEGGVFKGTITDTEFDPNGTYDWYAVYPYSKYMASPAESNSGSYFVVGSKNINTQQQTGIDNQAHICGENIPLYGKATGVTESPRLEMHHIATLFRINVNNTGSADLNVTGITLTSASENLIGSYYFDITGETPVLTPYRDDYVSKTATLNVTDGIVAPDATGSFYLATRAFTAPEGEQLTLTVTANGETVEKVATLSKETTFAAGTINKLNINVAAEAYVPAEYAIITNPADIDVTATYFIGGNNEETVAASPTMHMFTGSVVTGSNDWRLVTKEYTFDSSTNTFNDITGIAPVTLENAGVENTYYIKVGENYLCNISTGTTSGEKGLALQPTDPTAWTFETDTKKEGIYASSTLNGKKYILSCNGSSDALRLYGNTKYNGIYFFTEAGTPKTALETPTGVEAVAGGNEVLVGWNEVSGAASYTVSFEPATIEPQTVESTGEATYLNLYTLDYATEYTVSVVANPADTENYKASAPATATFTTGENPNVTYTQIKDLVKGETVAIKDALVVATSTRGPILWDETGAILAYQPSETPAIGSVVTVNATVGEYNKALQLNDATFTVTGTTEVPTQTATEVTAANIDDLMTVESVTATYVKFTGTLNISGSYYIVVFPFETNYQGSLYYPDAEALGLAALDGRKVNVEGWFTSITTYGESPKYLNVVATQVSSASEAPYITADETASFVAAGETKTISFLTDNLGSNQVFAAISGDGAGQFSVGQIRAESVTVTAIENTETTAKTATLTLYIAASEGGEHLAEATVALTQAGVPSGEAEWHAESWSTLNQSANTYGAGSISGDLGTWEYTGCSGYDMEQFNTKKSLALGKTSDNSSITSPTFANGISGIKFNYFANNTARTILVTIYENGVSVKQETITPTSKNQLGTATIDITTSGPTYFTFTPGSSDRRVSIGDIEVNY
mgnify:FL=1